MDYLFLRLFKTSSVFKIIEQLQTQINYLLALSVPKTIIYIAFLTHEVEMVSPLKMFVLVKPL
ncbi:hypothetical protein SBF1_3590006 [Candidatus Desulfosporosinus infrequens]|uniref:Uncharacterized protein n=1 Tax=Candidatus Desulfosporosinus infrequens TaxID=2043169 RepID=A0A2U3L3F3_9FIRM|nr:hypothetical protein SBF1_3590006 [Candidatus Desulfosporosinus infrequens]